jgi:hypothetical protein
MLSDARAGIMGVASRGAQNYEWFYFPWRAGCLDLRVRIVEERAPVERLECLAGLDQLDKLWPEVRTGAFDRGCGSCHASNRRLPPISIRKPRAMASMPRHSLVALGLPPASAMSDTITPRSDGPALNIIMGRKARA